MNQAIWAFGLALLLAGCSAARAASLPDIHSDAAQARARQLAAAPPVSPPEGRRVVLDESGRREVGKASFYSRRFQGRHMADGQPFQQTGQAAASKTLPIGTIAKVTNTQTGQTAMVQVEDRGPFVDGRAIDVSRATAAQLGITPRAGVAPVVVAPVVVPQRDGSAKVGAGALPGPAR